MDTPSAATTQPPPRPGLLVGVGGVGVIKKVGKPAANLILRDAVPMFQCALCGVRYHLVNDLVKHVEKGQHFDIDACLDSGHEVRASSSGSSSVTSCSAPYSDIERWFVTTTSVKRPSPYEGEEFRSFSRFETLHPHSSRGQSQITARVPQRFTRKSCTATSSSISKSMPSSLDGEDVSNTSSFGRQQPVHQGFRTEEELDLPTQPKFRHEEVTPESFPDEETRGPTNYSFRPRKSSLYRCVKCRSGFDSASQLKSHASLHALDCDYCDRSFLVQSALEEHISKEHCTFANPAAVGVTEQRDPEEEQLAEVEEQEVELQDESQQPYRAGSIFQSDVLIEELEGCYRCQICRKVCSARSDMQKHVRRHTDERPYSCYICSERFKHRSAITNHLRIHTGERPYSCIYCGKQFSQHSNKRRHEALHRGERPFRCVLCGRTFSEKTTLQTHMLQHTGERPFICEYCHKGHITKSALARHKCTHKCTHKRRSARKSSTTTGAGSEGGSAGSLDFELDSTGTRTGTDNSASYGSQ